MLSPVIELDYGSYHLTRVPDILRHHASRFASRPVQFSRADALRSSSAEATLSAPLSSTLLKKEEIDEHGDGWTDFEPAGSLEVACNNDSKCRTTDPVEL